MQYTLVHFYHLLLSFIFMLSESWVKVFSSSQLYLAEIVKGVLEENEVPTILLNKQASIYNMFGEIEVYVVETDSLKAYYLINQNNL